MASFSSSFRKMTPLPFAAPLLPIPPGEILEQSEKSLLAARQCNDHRSARGPPLQGFEPALGGASALPQSACAPLSGVFSRHTVTNLDGQALGKVRPVTCDGT